MLFISRTIRLFSLLTWISCWLFPAFISYSQSTLVIPEARFEKDSVKIGEPLRISISYRHKPNVEILFPDSTFDFSPFEFIKKEYFPTVSDSLESKDSIIYTLSTFELTSPQKISLPVFMYTSGDTTSIYSNEAEIYLKEVIEKITPADSLKVNTDFTLVNKKLNYPYLLLFLGILIIILAISVLFFRKPLLKRYKLYQMSRDFDNFNKSINSLHVKYNHEKSVEILEDILSLWKKYLQKLEKAPYTTLTTKEISKLFEYNQITSSLQNFDRAIYGGYIKEDLNNSIQYLKETATQRYQSKQKEVKNG